MRNRGVLRRYSLEQRAEAVALAGRVGLATAAEKLGIPKGTISFWMFVERKGDAVAGDAPSSARSRRDGKPATEVPIDVRRHADVPDGPRVAGSASGRRVYAAWQRAEVVAYTAKHGPSAASRKFKVSRQAINKWCQKAKRAAAEEASSRLASLRETAVAVQRDPRVPSEHHAQPEPVSSPVPNQVRGVELHEDQVSVIADDSGNIAFRIGGVHAEVPRSRVPSVIGFLQFVAARPVQETAGAATSQVAVQVPVQPVVAEDPAAAEQRRPSSRRRGPRPAGPMWKPVAQWMRKNPGPKTVGDIVGFVRGANLSRAGRVGEVIKVALRKRPDVFAEDASRLWTLVGRRGVAALEDKGVEAASTEKDVEAAVPVAEPPEEHGGAGFHYPGKVKRRRAGTVSIIRG